MQKSLFFQKHFILCLGPCMSIKESLSMIRCALSNEKNVVVNLFIKISDFQFQFLYTNRSPVVSIMFDHLIQPCTTGLPSRRLRDALGISVNVYIGRTHVNTITFIFTDSAHTFTLFPLVKFI